MSKLTQADINKLIKHFKELVETDVVGITSNDAKVTVADWLYELGEAKLANHFQNKVTDYSLSPKIQKMIEQNDKGNF